MSEYYNIEKGPYIMAMNRLEDALESLSESVEMYDDAPSKLIGDIKKRLPFAKKWYSEVQKAKKQPIVLGNSNTGKEIKVSFEEYKKRNEIDFMEFDTEKYARELIADAERIISMHAGKSTDRKQKRRVATTRKRASNPNVATANRVTKNLNKMVKRPKFKF